MSAAAIQYSTFQYSTVVASGVWGGKTLDDAWPPRSLLCFRTVAPVDRNAMANTVPSDVKLSEMRGSRFLNALRIKNPDRRIGGNRVIMQRLHLHAFADRKFNRRHDHCSES